MQRGGLISRLGINSFRIFIAATITAVIVFSFLSSDNRNVLYVSPDGDDMHPGTKALPLQSIQRATDLLTTGGTIHILPGIYRETVVISGSQSADTRIVLRADNTGDSRAILSGSEPSSRLSWQPCDTRTCPDIPELSVTNVYRATVPWDEEPTQLVQTLPDGNRMSLPLARGPNAEPDPGDRFHKSWWQANDQSRIPDTIAATHLETTSNLLGARAYIMDGKDRCGAYLHIRSVTDHDRSSATITTDSPIGALTYGNQENGLGRHTRFMVENVAGLLDAPGEWYYDPKPRTLYLWPTEGTDPARLSVEISRRSTGLAIDTSGVTISGLTIQNINDRTYRDIPGGAIVFSGGKNIRDILLDGTTIAFAGNGVIGEPGENGSIYNVRIRNADIHNTTKSAIAFAGSPGRPDNVKAISIASSGITVSGFPTNEPAIHIIRSSSVAVEKNAVANTAGYGIHVTGFEHGDRASTGIRISGNTVSHACQNASGCAAVKFFGGRFSDTEVTGNTLTDNVGWSSCQEETSGISGDAVGVFISNASGVTVKDNTALRNAGTAYLAFSRQFPATDNRFIGNYAAFSQTGIAFTGNTGGTDTDPAADAARHDRSRIERNILIRNTTALDLDPAHPESLAVRGNIFIGNSAALRLGSLEADSPASIPRLFPSWESGLLSSVLKIAAFNKILPVLFIKP